MEPRSPPDPFTQRTLVSSPVSGSGMRIFDEVLAAAEIRHPLVGAEQVRAIEQEFLGRERSCRRIVPPVFQKGARGGCVIVHAGLPCRRESRRLP
jgi:hypothetical protein